MKTHTKKTTSALEQQLAEIDRISRNLARATAAFWETERRLAGQLDPGPPRPAANS
jgi:hypothetical protein